MTHINVGYADVSQDGIFVTDLESHPEIYHIQLYHYLVVNLGGIKNMKGKSMLETGCGKGGGLNYLATACRPDRIVGVDISTQCVNILEFSSNFY